MPLEIQTIYNAAYSNCIYKHKLDSYKNDGELENNDSCSEFTNSNLINQDESQKICKAVILFLSHLKEYKVVTYGDTVYGNTSNGDSAHGDSAHGDSAHGDIAHGDTAYGDTAYGDTAYGDTEYGDTTYRDNGCKYLFYWLYNHVLKNGQTIENVLNMYKDLYRIYIQHHDNLNTFDKYINEMNEHTSYKLVRLTNLYNELDKFFTQNEEKKEKTACNSYSLVTYFSYVDECQNGYDNDFCDELKNFRKKYNSFIKNVIKCEEKYLLPPVERIDAVDMTIIPFSFISVTSLILPILYKFTAFGPWIRRLIGKKENILEYINEETHHTLNTYEIGNDNSNMPNYNIAYNSY
ncbi:PIR protein [Plasmodium ovale]|uniref:PIR protein n=1 Tax=Plasmodium ovale TaxID=36330 RepID=A0A1D3JDA1_PLAOA|nr:PIR protein [Plasmodium ovale]